ncbi:MarR family winged helix-turn-helix transcriptional regulator [Ramlibacter sp.]|uniref:MarR family winged helix-turn-helix transcriptional regulator n=1 Tax=Ramlibacter sp. TaxID=1917967 RepID=UPI003D1391E5
MGPATKTSPSRFPRTKRSAPEAPQAPGLDPGLADSLDYLIRTLRRRQVGVIERLLEPLGIPLGGWYPLVVLNVEDGMSQRELSRRLGLKDAAIGKAIDNLQHAGLLLRTADDTDRRKFLIRLTPQGRKLAAEVTGLRDEVLAYLTRGFTPKESELFKRLLQRAHNNLSELETSLGAANEAARSA